MFPLTLLFKFIACRVHISFSFAIISRPTATSVARIRRDGTMEIMKTCPTLTVCLISMPSSGRTYDRSLPGYPTHEHPHHLLRPFESHTTWKGPGPKESADCLAPTKLPQASRLAGVGFRPDEVPVLVQSRCTATIIRTERPKPSKSAFSHHALISSEACDSMSNARGRPRGSQSERRVFPRVAVSRFR